MTIAAESLHELNIAPSVLTGIGWAERGWLPDPLLRLGIRRLCAERLQHEYRDDWHENLRKRLEILRTSAIAIHTDTANNQHYELPPTFFELVLGKRLKYSSGFYPTGNETLDQAEIAMLDLYFERGELQDGQKILDLGCGWGSLSLAMAERLPNAQIAAISNSQQQRNYIETQCRARHLNNVHIITADVNQLALDPAQFDRCVSIEMFEHMRNYENLLDRIGNWLKPDDKLFVHIFCHRELCYPFDTDGNNDWMARHFFTSGLMPAANTLLNFQRNLKIEDHWRINGTHYQRTANHWLANQDTHRNKIHNIFSHTYGEKHARLWHQRWRIFWIACAELFGYQHGQQWLIAHYRFAKR